MYWILFGGIALVSFLVQWNLKNKFEKYGKILLPNRMTGKDIAIKMLHDNGIYDVRVISTPGQLTDHYNPVDKTVNLSEDVYNDCSVAAAAVAAHECGHALQHEAGYLPLKLRSVSVPIANFGSWLSWPVILLGLILGYGQLAQIGVLLFTLVVLFQLITLPVEFNASHRAIDRLVDDGFLASDEIGGAKKVLSAAAMTYVAAAFAAVAQLLRLIAIFGRRDD